MVKIAIVDSGSANLSSVYKALIYVGADVYITGEPCKLKSAGGIVFPGVGSFNYAVTKLRETGLDEAILSSLAAGKPFLGICLGLQLLFSNSEEIGAESDAPPSGLNVIPGQVKRFSPGLPVPHVGWNSVQPCYRHPLFEGLLAGTYFYFTHSYYVKPDDQSHTLAQAEYGETFTTAVAKDNLIGVQFHPEKSGPAGLQIFSNFGKIIADL